MVRRIFRKVFFLLSFFVLCGFLFFFLWVRPRYVVPVLMYHSVSPTDSEGRNTITPENFQRHMEYLRIKKYTVISLDTWVQLIKNRTPLNKKYAVITFDDGVEDNYTYAYPILKSYGYPATIFLIASTVDTQGWLGWAQIQEMEQGGITFGSHTLTHPYLPNLDPQKIRSEVRESKKILERNLGHPVHVMAYPTGGFTEEIKEIVRQEGYVAACTTNRGYDRSNKDLYEVKRIRLGDEDHSSFVLWAKLSGYYNLFRKARSPGKNGNGY